MPLSPLTPTKKVRRDNRSGGCPTVLYLPLAHPPNALLCSLPFYPHNDIDASTSAILSIKKPETCVSGAFGGDNRTRTCDLMYVKHAL